MNLPKVVIIGGGFAGLETAQRLRRAQVDVTLVDRNNYHLFQPLLYQVATGGLSPANIATPLRAVLSRQKNCNIVLGNVTGLDYQKRTIALESESLPFDYLVVAAGASHSYFGNDDWEERATGLKTLSEATQIRRQIFLAFEAAEREPDLNRRKELMTFVVIGAGPTGVELCGALSEISRHTLKHEFRNINPEDARIILIESGKHVLAGYPEDLCRCAEKKIEKLGIELRLERKVVEIEVDRVTTEMSDNSGDEPRNESIDTSNIFWAAGVKGNVLGDAIGNELGVPLHSSGRVPVTPTLTVGDTNNVFVIGDLAHSLDAQGKPLPGVAPVAIQQGRYVAKRIKAHAREASERAQPKSPSSGGGSNVIGYIRRLFGGQSVSKAEPFRYRDLGQMATIGRAAAIAKIGKMELCGFVAWLMWLGVHLMQLVQFQNRLLVLIQWGWNYITYNRSARIIVRESQDVDNHRTTEKLNQSDEEANQKDEVVASAEWAKR